MVPSVLLHESHLHLYGCLDARSLWAITEERSRAYATRFHWFLSEYERVTGRKLDPKRWWTEEDQGFAEFKSIYICDRPVSFDLFQAKFNLLIALFPPNPDELWLPNAVFSHHAIQGGYKEYRTFLPLYLPANERARYLQHIIELAQRYETSSYHPRIAISLMRNDAEAWEGYRFLRHFLDKHQDLAPMVTGIDFCASEQGHPPRTKKDLFNDVQADNAQRSHKLEILYHVGEMWQDISIASAARWCAEASALGAHRLGHALALGMDVSSISGGKIRETKLEAEEHLAWIRNHLGDLQESGFGPNDYQWLSERKESLTKGDFVDWSYDDDLIDHTSRFQDAAIAMVAKNNPIVECCPTSNIRIGNLKNSRHHPLRRFLANNLRVVVSTDDPGVFAISLNDEERLLKKDFQLSNQALVTMNQTCLKIFET